MPRSMHIRAAALLPLAFVLVSCDATEPPEPFTIALTAVPGEGRIERHESGQPMVSCDIRLTARATGPSGQEALWGDATFRMHLGPEEAGFRDSVRVPSNVVAQSWGSSAVVPGREMRSGWTFSAGAAFRTEMVYGYTVDGDGPVRTTEPVRFACGTPVPPGTPGPRLEEIVLDPVQGPVRVGDRLRITYRAESPMGLWETEVVVSGAETLSRRFDEGGATSTARTVEFTVGSGAKAGEPYVVRIRAADLGLRQVEAGPLSMPPVGDVVPPTVTASLDAHPVTRRSYAHGDTIRLSITATDDRELAYVAYEAGAPISIRDSIPVSGAQPGPRVVEIPVRAEWTGPVVLTVQARDAGGLASNTVSLKAGLFPRHAGAVRSTTIPDEYSHAVLDARRNRVYLVDGGTWTPSAPPQVAVVSLESMAAGPPIPLPSLPSDADLTAGGDSLVVALVKEKALGIVDLRAPGAALSLIPLQEGSIQPIRVRVAANGRALVLGMDRRLVEVDLSSGAQRVLPRTRDTGSSPASMAVSDDRSRVYVQSGCSHVYEAETSSIPACRTLNMWGRASMSASGHRIAVGIRIYDEDLRYGTEVPFFGASGTSVLSPDGSALYVASGDGVDRVLVADDTLDLRFPNFPAGPSLFVTPDGRRLVAVARLLQGGTRISVTTL